MASNSRRPAAKPAGKRPRDSGLARGAVAPDPLRVLRADHVRVRRLLVRLESAHDRRERADLLRQVEAELLVHSRLEEEMFYPAYREAAQTLADRRLFFDAHEEHKAAERLLEEMVVADAGGEAFEAQCTLLRRLVEDHIGEEERELFVRARRLVPRELMRRLAEDMQQRRNELHAVAPEGLRRPSTWRAPLWGRTVPQPRHPSDDEAERPPK